MTTDMTTAFTDAYFRTPPVSDILRTGLYDYVLACPVSASPWQWNASFGMLIHSGTGEAKPRTGTRRANDSATDAARFYDPRTINAEVRVSQSQTDWQETGIGLEGDMTIHRIVMDGIGRRLRGDGPMWRLQQKDLRRDEQKARAKRFHPAQRNVSPKDYMTADDRTRFIELGREIMANVCHLSMYLPRCQIMAAKLPIRLMEMVEWEMINVAEWGRGLTAKIDDASRATGAKGAPEIDDMKIERFEQQREGARFQYYFLQLLFHAFQQQYVDVALEFGGLMQSSQHHGELEAEHTGRTWQYVPVLERQERKKQRNEAAFRLSEVERAMLIGKPPTDWAAFFERKTGMKPRKVPSAHLRKATPQVAQPMPDDEVAYDPSDDLGNVRWEEDAADGVFEE